MTIAWNIKDLKSQYENTESGHWFDSDAIRFFKTRFTSHYIRIDDHNALFITTEQGRPDNQRKASVRHAKLVEYIRESDSRKCYKITVDTIGPFCQNSVHQSKKIMGGFETPLGNTQHE